MGQGYPNAAYVYNSDSDHGYTVLPFSGAGGMVGAIVIDPTSDQLTFNCSPMPRNNVFVALGNSWEYRIEWEEGSDLFPDLALYLKNIKVILGYTDLKKHHNADKFLNEAFRNPVSVKTGKDLYL